jgi:phage shock protein A
MSIFKKIMTAVRGGATEAGEAIVDSQSMRILDQEIRDAERDIQKATVQLTNVMAEHQVHADSVTSLEAKFSSYEANAMAALEKGDETLANKVAEKLSEIETEITEVTSLRDQAKQNSDQLKSLVSKNRSKLKAAKSSVSSLKAREAINKASESLVSSTSGVSTNLNSMGSTLDKLKAKQAKDSHRIAASQQLADDASGKSLDDELSAAGIGGEKTSASDMMARLKAKQKA